MTHATVALYLPTLTGDVAFGSQELWSRHVPMTHLPNVGELIALHDETQMFIKVRARYWSTTGNPSLDMQGFIIDPPNGTTFDGSRYISWLTHLDGNLAEFLTENGWTLQ